MLRYIYIAAFLPFIILLFIKGAVSALMCLGCHILLSSIVIRCLYRILGIDYTSTNSGASALMYQQQRQAVTVLSLTAIGLLSAILFYFVDIRYLLLF